MRYTASPRKLKQNSKCTTSGNVKMLHMQVVIHDLSSKSAVNQSK